MLRLRVVNLLAGFFLSSSLAMAGAKSVVIDLTDDPNSKFDDFLHSLDDEQPFDKAKHLLREVPLSTKFKGMDRVIVLFDDDSNDEFLVKFTNDLLKANFSRKNRVIIASSGKSPTYVPMRKTDYEKEQGREKLEQQTPAKKPRANNRRSYRDRYDNFAR